MPRNNSDQRKEQRRARVRETEARRQTAGERLLAAIYGMTLEEWETAQLTENH